MLRQDARPGMKVVFGRPGVRAEKTLGEIVKCNPTRAVVKTLEQRGTLKDHPIGTKYTVDYRIMEPAPENGNKHEVTIAPRRPTPTGEITPGVTTFRSHYADSNPLWRVIRQNGRDTWLCEIVNEKLKINGKEYDSDWVGTQKAFLTREIVGSIVQASIFDNLMSEHDRFYASLKPGQIVHYQNGFDQWVRCTVVTVEGKNKLQAIALIGPWSKTDLPRRMRDGSIYLGHYGEQIQERETFEPNFTNIYESGSEGARPRNGIPPTTLTPLDLTVPPQTPEEARISARWARIGEIQDLLNKSGDNPIAILDEVRRRIDQPY